jgi:hypothetical protein
MLPFYVKSRRRRRAREQALPSSYPDPECLHPLVGWLSSRFQLAPLSASIKCVEGGISGVPTVIVNGQPVFSGAPKAEVMIAKIRENVVAGSSLLGTAPVRQAG